MGIAQYPVHGTTYADLFKQKKEDDRIQEATNIYFDIILKDIYPPVLDWNCHFQLQVLKPILWEYLIDWIEYFLYEAESFYPNCKIEVDWKETIITSDTDAILWLVNTYWG